MEKGSLLRTAVAAAGFAALAVVAAKPALLEAIPPVCGTGWCEVSAWGGGGTCASTGLV